MRNKPRRVLRKGVSDLVVVLALVAIAIPVALALQGWLSSQASRMNSYTAVPQISSTLVSKSVTSTSQIFVVRIKNTGNYNYSLPSEAKAILVNGKVVSAKVYNTSNIEKLQPGTTIILSVTVENKVSVKTIVLILKNLNTGKEEILNINVE